MSTSRQWSDLSTRLTSAIVMIVIGFVGLWMGGIVFQTLVAICAALMLWELLSMAQSIDKTFTLATSAVGGVIVFALPHLAPVIALLALAVPVLMLFFKCTHQRLLFSAYAALILLGSYGLILIRLNMGFNWVCWFITLVVATDVMGYFAGRFLGGPKFWPAISPKKTWSGTVFGWIGACLVGMIFALNSGVMAQTVVLSLFLSFGSQMGDILESAIKRKMNVKDSSQLIPGHGGFLDRFDGMIGASVLLILIGLATGFPPGLIS